MGAGEHYTERRVGSGSGPAIKVHAGGSKTAGSWGWQHPDAHSVGQKMTKSSQALVKGTKVSF